MSQKLFPKGLTTPTFAKKWRPSRTPVTLSVSEGEGWVDLDLTLESGASCVVRMSLEDADLLSKQLAPYSKARAK